MQVLAASISSLIAGSTRVIWTAKSIKATGCTHRLRLNSSWRIGTDVVQAYGYGGYSGWHDSGCWTFRHAGTCEMQTVRGLPQRHQHVSRNGRRGGSTQSFVVANRDLETGNKHLKSADRKSKDALRETIHKIPPDACSLHGEGASLLLGESLIWMDGIISNRGKMLLILRLAVVSVFLTIVLQSAPVLAKCVNV
ncbi:MAG: hypothetical protein ACERJ2_19150, partial [Filomicrobium sp.]